MTKQQMVPVSRRALIARINRRLSSKGEKLRTTRGVKAREMFGAYHVTQGRPGYYYVTDSQIDLERLGKKLGVLRAGEVLRDE